jgi:hypothetical protein
MVNFTRQKKEKTMSEFAVLNQNNVVINVIIADNKTIAETATQSTCYEILDKGAIVIGSKLLDNGNWEFPEGHISIKTTEELIAEALKNKIN